MKKKVMIKKNIFRLKKKKLENLTLIKNPEFRNSLKVNLH